MTRIVLTATMAVVLAAPGCAKDTATRQAEADVRAVLDRLQQSLASGDVEQFLSCLRGNEAEMTSAEAAFGFWQAGYDFRDAYIETYGRRSWNALQRSRARLRLPPRDAGFWRRLDVIVKGDRARIERELDIRLFRLHRRDGVWRLDADGFVPSGGKPEIVAEASRAMAEVVRRQIRRIGQPGVDDDDIRRTLTDAFAREVDAVSAEAAPDDPNETKGERPDEP